MRLNVWSLLNALAILFLLWGYFGMDAYYFPTNNGILGDNYLHLLRSVENVNYLKHHHLLYHTSKP